MGRDEDVNYEQDRLGNERRKLDRLRAQEGMVDGDDQGITEITSTNTGTIQTLHSLPAHTDEAIVTELHAYNGDSVSGTYSLYELTLDENGSIASSTRRSVPIDLATDATRINSYEGTPFTGAIGVSAEFQGWIGVGLLSDHKEYNEADSENY